VDWRGAIVFLEDLDERPYRIDRMLFQLREAGKLDGVRGLVFGEMAGCQPRDGEAPLEEVILRALGGLDVPIFYGFPSGHTTGANICLPLGVRARIADDCLTILEGAVC
jgi:muramoyltetrapeptide carboxypeptidase